MQFTVHEIIMKALTRYFVILSLVFNHGRILTDGFMISTLHIRIIHGIWKYVSHTTHFFLIFLRLHYHVHLYGPMYSFIFNFF